MFKSKECSFRGEVSLSFLADRGERWGTVLLHRGFRRDEAEAVSLLDEARDVLRVLSEPLPRLRHLQQLHSLFRLSGQLRELNAVRGRGEVFSRSDMRFSRGRNVLPA